MPGGWGTRSRIDALDVDVERLIRGWDQYVPRLLASVADVRADVFEATELQARIRRLEDAVSKLEVQARAEAKAPPGTAAEGPSLSERRK